MQEGVHYNPLETELAWSYRMDEKVVFTATDFPEIVHAITDNPDESDFSFFSDPTECKLLIPWSLL